jgi:hypothetical protein
MPPYVDVLARVELYFYLTIPYRTGQRCRLSLFLSSFPVFPHALHMVRENSVKWLAAARTTFFWFPVEAGASCHSLQKFFAADRPFCPVGTCGDFSGSEGGGYSCRSVKMTIPLHLHPCRGLIIPRIRAQPCPLRNGIVRQSCVDQARWHLYVLLASIVLHVMWVPLSPLHGASSDCGWRRRPPDMEGSCEYIE